MTDPHGDLPRPLGRYELHEPLGRGGMATVHLGRIVGDGGFAKAVAIKRLHEPFATDPRFMARFQHEARLAARVSHPNVVSTLDVLAEAGNVFIVMELVHGVSLARLMEAEHDEEGRAPAHAPDPSPALAVVPVDVAATMVRDLLLGLHAAHEATDERGAPLNLVHRDVSPQNLIVGADGMARVLDFGIAKARDDQPDTEAGVVKGKMAYMAPEQLCGDAVDRRTDLYAVGLIAWELFVGRRGYGTATPAPGQVLRTVFRPPGVLVPTLPPDLDEVVMKALEHDPEDRFPNALEMAEALTAAVTPASHPAVAGWVRDRRGTLLDRRAATVSEMILRPATDADAGSSAATTAPMSVTPSARPSPIASRGRVVVATVLSVALAAFFGIWWLRPDRAPATSNPAPETRRVEARGPTASSRRDVSAPWASSSSPLVAAPATVTAPSAAPPAPPSPRVRVRPSARPTPARRTHARDACDPPWSIDASGHKIYKRACF
ncbi:MAG: serine/threonine-protein kinase [Myxococcota bacterium]